MKSRLIIAVDCDDVLINATHYLVGTYNERYGTSVQLAHAHMSKNPEWRAARSEVFRRIHEIQRSEGYAAIAPSAQTIGAISDLTGRHDLHLVTARSDEILDVTRLMLDTFFRDSFLSVEHVGPDRSKGEVCASLHADILIDDNLRHLEDASAHGVKGLLWFGAYPWQDPQTSNSDSIVRCINWAEVRERIEHFATK